MLHLLIELASVDANKSYFYILHPPASLSGRESECWTAYVSNRLHQGAVISLLNHHIQPGVVKFEFFPLLKACPGNLIGCLNYGDYWKHKVYH